MQRERSVKREPQHTPTARALTPDLLEHLEIIGLEKRLQRFGVISSHEVTVACTEPELYKLEMSLTTNRKND